MEQSSIAARLAPSPSDRLRAEAEATVEAFDAAIERISPATAPDIYESIMRGRATAMSAVVSCHRGLAPPPSDGEMPALLWAFAEMREQARIAVELFGRKPS